MNTSAKAGTPRSIPVCYISPAGKLVRKKPVELPRAVAPASASDKSCSQLLLLLPNLDPLFIVAHLYLWCLGALYSRIPATLKRYVSMPDSGGIANLEIAQSKAFLLTLLSRHSPGSVFKTSTFVQTLLTTYINYPRLRLQYGISLCVLVGIVCGTCHCAGRLKGDIFTARELFEDLKVENKHSIHGRVQRLELT